jgi:hypothetical protein
MDTALFWELNNGRQLNCPLDGDYAYFNPDEILDGDLSQYENLSAGQTELERAEYIGRSINKS